MIVTFTMVRKQPQLSNEAGRAHWADLQTFMDIDNSPTVVVTHEANVEAAGTMRTRFVG